jgi:dolichol-phosphate mannosyltransferase
MQIYTLLPLVFFALFSLNHEINLNWIGPLFLALIPWLAASMANTIKKRTICLRAAAGLLASYIAIFLVASLNTSELVQQRLLIKAVAWEPLIKQFHELAQRIEAKTKRTPIFVPLDNFPIGSELSFYQAKLLAQGKILKTYPIIGSHIFGGESLMYRYWSNNEALDGIPLIIISKELWRFDLPGLKKRVVKQSNLNEIWSSGQGQGVKNIPFYYKIVQLTK